MNRNKGVYILNLEAKDLWLSNHYVEPDPQGYNIHTKTGEINYRKFDGMFDYSLDWIKLKKVYYSTYLRRSIVFTNKGKAYTDSVINVTFNYSVKEFNKEYYNPKEDENVVGKERPKAYIRAGYKYSNLDFNDCVCKVDGKLVGVICGVAVSSPLNYEELEGYFVYRDGCYHEVRNKTVVGVADLRKWMYEEGFICNGKKYVRFKRSNGSSRVGKCLFIDEALAERMFKWGCCGIDPTKLKEPDLAAFEAYIGLTLSSIIDTIEIYPENILVVDDYESSFQEKMIITREVDGWLSSKVEDTIVTNKIWDGQSLMDVSLFEGYEEHGMLLLRNRFFKSCCFNTNLQQWFSDNNITDVSQLNGFTLAERIEDIKLITTPSSIKYLKFGTLKAWLRKLNPTFGIVKYEKPTHYLDGKLVSTHYQLLNTLEMTEAETKELLQPTIDFLNLIDSNPAVLRHYIKLVSDTAKVSIGKDKNDVIISLLSITDKFAETKMYEDFKIDLMKSIKADARKGRVRVNGTYATMAGNPIEMLQFAIGKFDGKTQIGVGNIYSKNFAFNKTILGSRSPHVCASNIYLANNVYNAAIEKYLNLSCQIVVVNSIDEPLLDRFSGSDFDSDTCMLTDNEVLIKAARKNYDKFLVPMNRVQAKKVYREYCWQELADLDIKTSCNKIGEDINLAQILTTLFWDCIHSGQTFEDNLDLYCDIVSLDILSNIEIDKAKKEFVINTKAEIDKLRRKYLQRDSDGKTILPRFFGFIAKTKGYYDKERKKYTYHNSTMDYVERIMSRLRFKHRTSYLKISDLICPTDGEARASYEQRRLIFEAIDAARARIAVVRSYDSLTWTEKKEAYTDIFEERNNYINKFKLNINTMKLLVATMENKKYSKYRTALFYMVFNLKNKQFHDILLKSSTQISKVEPDNDGDIDIYGYKYRLI